MGKKSKKVYIFTEEERAEIDDILLTLVRGLQQFLDKDADPKKFADKLLSAAGLNITIPGQIIKRHSLDMETGQQVSPQDLRKILPELASLFPVWLVLSSTFLFYYDSTARLKALPVTICYQIYYHCYQRVTFVFVCFHCYHNTLVLC